MYEEKPKKNLSLNIDWKSLLIKLAILLVVVFILIFIVSLVKKDNKKLESNLSTNLQSMRVAAKEYFTESRLPTNVNGRKKITLGEMFENKLLVEFKDQNNKSCDSIGSFAEATKINSTDYTIKVKLVCGSESDYIIDTVKFEDNSIDVPNNTEDDDLQDDNNQNNTDNNVNSGTTNNNNSNSKPSTKPTTSNKNPINNVNTKPSNPVASACTYGDKDYTSSYPLAYVIPGNCAVSKNDFYKAEYANKVSSISALEYIKLSNEALSLKNKTGVNVYVETPTYYGVYNKSGKGLVGYQILFTMKQKVNYVVTTVYQYYLDSNGNRKVIIDKRDSISSSEKLSRYCKTNTERVYSIGYVNQYEIKTLGSYKYEVVLNTKNTNFLDIKYGNLLYGSDYVSAYNYFKSKNKPLDMIDNNSSTIDPGNSTNLNKYSLKSSNFTPTVSYARKNGDNLHFVVNINLKNVDNIRNANLYYVNNMGVYFVPLYFDVKTIDYNNCVNINNSQAANYIKNGYLLVN